MRRDLTDLLRSVTTPNGRNVFEEVRPRGAYFSGPETDRTVDIVIVPADFDHFLSAKFRDEQFGPPTEPWNHKLDGIFVADGADIATDADLGDPHLLDVAPTVLVTLGVPRDERMDGEPLPCVESTGSERIPRFEVNRSIETADEQVEDRLSDLGYLE